MYFYISAQFSRTSELPALAQAAEKAGLDGLALGDHLFLSDEPSSPYPYSADGSLPFPHDVDWPDVWVTIGALAARTTTLRFLTHVYVLPLRNPLLVAKAAATAAVFAPGRVLLGIGIGWLRDEFDTQGLPFETRGRRTDDSILVLRELWSTGHLEKRHNSHFRFPALTMQPQPPESIPILVGGESEAARNRAASLADGFLSLSHPTDDLIELIQDMRERVIAHGRDPNTFMINARCSDPCDITGLERLERAMAASVNLTLWPMEASLEEKLSAISRFGVDVLQPYRARRKA